jgi:hypothetical protein
MELVFGPSSMNFFSRALSACNKISKFCTLRLTGSEGGVLKLTAFTDRNTSALHFSFGHHFFDILRPATNTGGKKIFVFSVECL